MDTRKAIEVLEALASGRSPRTGEAIPDESILNERDVIRALQIAINELKDISTGGLESNEVNIYEGDINKALKIFFKLGIKPSPPKISALFLGSKQFKNRLITSSDLFGKYKKYYTRDQLLDFFNEYFSGSNNVQNDKSISENDFFENETFNNLSEKAINQLREKINSLGILKTTKLSEKVIEIRKEHPRAFEAWSYKEKELLAIALQYTNDIDLLSECFQRGKGAIESYGNKIIEENKNNQPPVN